MALTKGRVLKVRAFLGAGASVPDVAEALKVHHNTVRVIFNAKERHLWALAVKAEQLSPLEKAIRKVKVKYLALDKIPTARQSGVHTSIQTLLGGYNAIVKASGLRG